MSRENPYESFTKELKAVRLARRMTQAQVAKEIGLSRAQYTAIECGRSTATFRHLHNLAVVLKVRWNIGKTDADLASKVAKAA